MVELRNKQIKCICTLSFKKSYINVYACKIIQSPYEHIFITISHLSANIGRIHWSHTRLLISNDILHLLLQNLWNLIILLVLILKIQLKSLSDLGTRISPRLLGVFVDILLNLITYQLNLPSLYFSFYGLRCTRLFQCVRFYSVPICSVF